MKNLKKIFSTAVILALLSLSLLKAQETIRVDRFNEIVATGIIDVVLQQGDEEKVVLYNNSGIDRDDIKVKVEHGVLKVRVLKSLIKDSDDVKVEVTYKQLKAIKVNAGAELSALNTIKADHLHVNANSGAEVTLDLDINDLEASASEGAEIELTGKTDSQEISVSSGAEYYALNLSCNYTYVKANTGGLAELVANESIEAGANTGGRVKYKGNPPKVKIKDKFGGDVDEM